MVAQLVKNPPAMQETPVRFHSIMFLGFPGGSAGKEYVCNEGDLGSIPGLGRFPGEGNCYPLQYSGLENSMDCLVHGITKSQTPLSDFHCAGLLICCRRSLWVFALLAWCLAFHRMLCVLSLSSKVLFIGFGH